MSFSEGWEEEAVVVVVVPQEVVVVVVMPEEAEVEDLEAGWDFAA